MDVYDKQSKINISSLPYTSHQRYQNIKDRNVYASAHWHKFD